MPGPGNASLGNSSCRQNMTQWEQQMETMYTYFYLLLFIPGLLLNTIALWVLCRYISKKTKAVIFMINLSIADLAHILSLPLRIYYYFTHTWPFGRGICLFCFYLKYLNMYAAIIFLVCISAQRCFFLLDPFSARRWRRRYDLLISLIVWVVVSLGCSPFILMRSSSSSGGGGGGSDSGGGLPTPILSTQTVYNLSYSPNALSFQHPPGYKSYASTFNSSSNTSSINSTHGGCFKDLPMRRLPQSLAITMMALAELFGFLIPLLCILYSSLRIAWSLKERRPPEGQSSTTANSTRSRVLSVTSVNGQTDNNREAWEKRRALRMVLSCTGLFLFCFAPYHVNFLLYLMVSQDIISNCTTRLLVRQFHPVSLCVASLSCCLNPLLYYFLTAEFRQHLAMRTSSFSSSLLSSPISPSIQRPAQQRLMSMESNCSE